jgi:hypothetical protein
LYLPIFETLIAIEDSLETSRLENGITTFCIATKSFHNNKDACARYSNYFEKLINTNTKLRKLIIQSKYRSLVLESFKEIELPTK